MLPSLEADNLRGNADTREEDHSAGERKPEVLERYNNYDVRFKPQNDVPLIKQALRGDEGPALREYAAQ